MSSKLNEVLTKLDENAEAIRSQIQTASRDAPKRADVAEIYSRLLPQIENITNELSTLSKHQANKTDLSKLTTSVTRLESEVQELRTASTPSQKAIEVVAKFGETTEAIRSEFQALSQDMPKSGELSGLVTKLNGLETQLKDLSATIKADVRTLYGDATASKKEQNQAIQVQLENIEKGIKTFEQNTNLGFKAVMSDLKDRNTKTSSEDSQARTDAAPEPATPTSGSTLSTAPTQGTTLHISTKELSQFQENIESSLKTHTTTVTDVLNTLLNNIKAIQESLDGGPSAKPLPESSAKPLPESSPKPLAETVDAVPAPPAVTEVEQAKEPEKPTPEVGPRLGPGPRRKGKQKK